MKTDLYIYYRVRCENAQQLQQRASAMQAYILSKDGIVAELKRRPAQKDGLHTWMEVYRDVPEGFDMMLEDALTRAELTPLIEGERNTEYFLDCSLCT
jgi:hypothetical protein